MRTSRSGESALLLLDVVEILAREQVDYAVVGAMAASVHGVSRASMDADAVLSITTQQLGQLQEQFRGAGFSTELRRGDIDDPIAGQLATVAMPRASSINCSRAEPAVLRSRRRSRQ